MNGYEAVVEVGLMNGRLTATEMFLKEVKYRMRDRPVTMIPCPNCSGEGRIGRKDGQVVRDCPRCDGTGEIPVYVDEGLEVYHEVL